MKLDTSGALSTLIIKMPGLIADLLSSVLLLRAAASAGRAARDVDGRARVLR